MTDIADFLVVYVDKSIPMCGTWEELFNANRQKKPILVFIEGGAKEASLWLHGTIHYKYIFENLGEVKSFIAAIDDGIVQMDGRWQLLDHVKLGDVPRPPMPEKLKRLFVYGCLLLAGAWMVARKRKIGFAVSNVGCLLQLLHVILMPSLIGLLILSLGFGYINTTALMSETWKDEKWL
jgi:hypothetical protein